VDVAAREKLFLVVVTRSLFALPAYAAEQLAMLFVYICIYKYTYMYTCIDILMYAYIYIYICTYIYPPDPINHVYSLPGKYISKKKFTYRSLQIFEIIFQGFILKNPTKI